MFYATAAALNANKNLKAKDLLISSIHYTIASKNHFLNFDKLNEFREGKLFSEFENEY